MERGGSTGKVYEPCSQLRTCLSTQLWNRIDGILCRMLVGFPVDFVETNTSPPVSTADQRMLSQLSSMGYHY